MKTIQEKIERMDLTMARRPKGNYEAYINQVSSVIVLQDEIKNEDKNMTKDTITISYNYNVKQKKKQKQKQKATGELKLKHIYMRTLSSYYRKTP